MFFGYWTLYLVARAQCAYSVVVMWSEAILREISINDEWRRICINSDFNTNFKTIPQQMARTVAKNDLHATVYAMPHAPCTVCETERIVASIRYYLLHIDRIGARDNRE